MAVPEITISGSEAAEWGCRRETLMMERMEPKPANVGGDSRRARERSKRSCGVALDVIRGGYGNGGGDDIIK